MAQIKTEYLTLKLSKLIRDNGTTSSVFTAEILSEIENAVTLIIGNNVVVETENIEGEE